MSWQPPNRNPPPFPNRTNRPRITSQQQEDTQSQPDEPPSYDELFPRPPALAVSESPRTEMQRFQDEMATEEADCFASTVEAFRLKMFAFIQGRESRLPRPIPRIERIMMVSFTSSTRIRGTNATVAYNATRASRAERIRSIARRVEQLHSRALP